MSCIRGKSLLEPPKVLFAWRAFYEAAVHNSHFLFLKHDTVIRLVVNAYARWEQLLHPILPLSYKRPQWSMYCIVHPWNHNRLGFGDVEDTTAFSPTRLIHSIDCAEEVCGAIGLHSVLPTPIALTTTVYNCAESRKECAGHCGCDPNLNLFFTERLVHAKHGFHCS